MDGITPELSREIIQESFIARARTKLSNFLLKSGNLTKSLLKTAFQDKFKTVRL